MPFIQDINFSVTSGTASVGRTGFRMLLMGSDTTEITEGLAADAAGVLALGYTVTDPEYLMAVQAFAQNPKPTNVLVFRKADDRGGYQELSSTTVTFVGEIVPALTAQTYAIDVTIDGGALGQLVITVAVTDDWFTIASKIQTALRTDTGSTETVVVTNGRIRVTSATTGGGSSVLIAAGTGVSVGGDLIAAITAQVTDMTVTVEAAVVGATQLYSEALAILLTRITSANNFRFVNIDSRVLADLNDVGTWAGSNAKIFAGGVNNVLAGSGRNGGREAYVVSDQQTLFPDVQWIAQSGSKTPGSYTLKFQKPNNMVAAGYSLTDLTTIRSLNTQSPQAQGGNIFMNEGLMTNGDFIDEVIFRDWVEEEMEARVLELFLANDKISLDDAGIKQTENVIRRVLKEGSENGGIAIVGAEADQDKSDDGEHQFRVVTPLRSEISVSDLAARTLTMTFNYVTAGAQHVVTGTGIVTV